MEKKPHDLPFASEQLPFKSNWHGTSLELAGEGVMSAPDPHALKSLFIFFSGYPRGPWHGGVLCSHSCSTFSFAFFPSCFHIAVVAGMLTSDLCQITPALSFIHLCLVIKVWCHTEILLVNEIILAELFFIFVFQMTSMAGMEDFVPT